MRGGKGHFVGRLADSLQGLRPHNLVTFKSHHEALDGWAMKELSGLDVAYRKLVSPSPSELLPEDKFGSYAVAARFPHNLSGQVPWQRVPAGVYDCRWGVDTIRVLVAGELPREPHNAPLHLFSTSRELVGFGWSAYRPRSPNTSALLGELFGQLRGRISSANTPKSTSHASRRRRNGRCCKRCRRGSSNRRCRRYRRRSSWRPFLRRRSANTWIS
jgi:hypothetical protein